MVQQPVDLAKIAAQLLRRHGGVLPSLPSMLFPGNEDGGAEGGFAHPPHAPGIQVGVTPYRACLAKGEGRLGESFRHSIGLFRRVGAKLAQQEAPAFGQQQHVVDRQLLAEHVVDHEAIEAFEANWLVLQDCGHVIGGDERIAKAKQNQAAMLRAMFERAA